jgi:signal transduction histidine kinase
MKEKLAQDAAAREVTREELLQENARLRGDLLTVAVRISHDLRTPLGGIVNTGELLKDMLIEKEPAAAELTDSLFVSVDEMSKLIGQIRIITRATADPKPKERVNMAEIVSGVLQRLESRFLKTEATVAEPGSWPEVNGVADWLEFIWWNFLANALQHAGEKPRIELNWRQEKEGFRFQVCDHGGGVPAEVRASLFQPFDSLHKPGSTYGLGLSVVQRLADLQGGDCGYEPNPKGGSCFYFTLPAYKHTDASCLSPAIPKIKSATKKSV